MPQLPFGKNPNPWIIFILHTIHISLQLSATTQAPNISYRQKNSRTTHQRHFCLQRQRKLLPQPPLPSFVASVRDEQMPIHHQQQQHDDSYPTSTRITEDVLHARRASGLVPVSKSDNPPPPPSKPVKTKHQRAPSCANNSSVLASNLESSAAEGFATAGALDGASTIFPSISKPSSAITWFTTPSASSSTPSPSNCQRGGGGREEMDGTGVSVPECAWNFQVLSFSWTLYNRYYTKKRCWKKHDT